MNSTPTNIRAVSSPTKHWRIFLSVVIAILGLACQHHETIVGPSPTTSIVSTPFVDDSLRRELTVDGLYGTLHGLVLRQPDTLEPTARIVVVIHHGAHGSIADYANHVQLLYDAGFDVVAWDYPGSGRSTGRLTEEALTLDVRGLVTMLRRDHYADDTRFVAYGISVGSVTALMQATLDSTWGVILESPIASADRLVQSSSTLDVAAEWRNGDSYDNVVRIRRLRSPLLILAGDADHVAPFQDHAAVLHQESPMPKRLVLVSGAQHSNVVSTLGREVMIDMFLAHLRR